MAKPTNDIELIDFSAAFATEVVKMWRRSFQRAMGLEEQNRLTELRGQVGFFLSLGDKVTIAIRPASSKVVGFMAMENEFELAHLYIDVEEQGKGYGSFMLNEARKRSPERLELFTFQKNSGAQAFYLKNGFVEVERGRADLENNPWTTNANDLPDIKYLWTPD